MDNFILKGDICYSLTKDKLFSKKDAYIIVDDGKSLGVFDQIDEKYKDYELLDYSGKLIIPGLVDIHLHAPQNEFKGAGIDLTLLDWLNTYTFPVESKYKDISYAREKYRDFIDELKKSPSTRFVIFGSIDYKSTLILSELMEESKLVSYIGKVNMDRNSPDFYIEDSTESLEDTIKFIEEIKDRSYKNTYPIITPRFIPSCTEKLLDNLGKLAKKYELKIQSHLSENKSEIAWVKDLMPEAKTYAHAYDKYDLFGSTNPTIMAHCVYSNDQERALMKERGVFIAHCPSSNMNLKSGIAPVRTYLQEGQNIGLGTDVAAGSTLSIFRIMTDAIQNSKLYNIYVNEKKDPLSLEEAFYLASLGGGSFFGKVGSFDYGYEFDALVIDDKRYNKDDNLEITSRLEKTAYLSEDRDIIAKFVRGKSITL